MKNYIFFSLWIHWILVVQISAQSNFSISDPFCEQLLRGNFPRDSFTVGKIKVLNDTKWWLNEQLNADSLKEHLNGITSFYNRNTIADYPELPDYGIRGARKWIHSKLNNWSQRAGSLMFPCEFEFDYTMCGKTRHSQLLTIIPGNSEIRDEMVILEAHLDSRCEALCDTACRAEGADDNGSGSALIMELARVLSRLELNRTLVILWTTGEEQGLGGARAFALYCKQNGIKIKAVFNNDVVGGIECGNTSSAPGCPGPGLLDSLRFRIFSSGTTNSMSKNQARLSKLITDHTLRNEAMRVPLIDVMFAEDRTGRGGDHIPFREQGYTSIRFTSSYEHGDGNPSQANYHDRQHSTRDVLGKDLDGDGKLDSLYVDFNYLRKNSLVNAWTLLHAASTNISPLLLKVVPSPKKIQIEIENPQGLKKFIFGIRNLSSAFFDTVIISDQTQISIEGLNPTLYYVTAAGIDNDGWYSMFGSEYPARVTTGTENENLKKGIELLQNKPNPFDEYTLIPILVHDLSEVSSSSLEITDVQGRLLKTKSLQLVLGVNEILLDIGAWIQLEGQYFYTLKINGNSFLTKKMIVNSY